MQLQIKCNIYTVYDSNKLSFFKCNSFVDSHLFCGNSLVVLLYLIILMNNFTKLVVTRTNSLIHFNHQIKY